VFTPIVRLFVIININGEIVESVTDPTSRGNWDQPIVVVAEYKFEDMIRFTNEVEVVSKSLVVQSQISVLTKYGKKAWDRLLPHS